MVSTDLDITSQRLVTFSLGDQRYALALGVVDRIVRAVEITPLPEAPTIVLGIVNLQGRIIPVVDVRRRFGLPPRDITPRDQMIIARTRRRTIALVVDSTTEVLDDSEHEPVPASEVLPELELVDGVVVLDDGLVLIHDLDSFLSLDEEAQLDRGLEKRPQE